MATLVVVLSVLLKNSEDGRKREADNLDESGSEDTLADVWLLFSVVKLFPFFSRVFSSI